MLAANANEPGFDLVVLSGVRRALATQAAAEGARQAEEARREAEEERA